MELDYEKAWEEAQDKRFGDIKSGTGSDRDWDRIADEYSRSVARNGFAAGERIADALSGIISPESQVLEIGAGPGTLLIPMARRVGGVVAVESSRAMVDCLERNAKERGISNYGVVNGRWQDVDDSKIAGAFDLVVSSSVVWQFRDVWKQLERMEKASRGYCCLIEHVGCDSGLVDMWPRIMGKKQNPWAIHGRVQCLLYGILYSHGRFCDVRILEHEKEVDAELMKKSIVNLVESYAAMNPELEKRIEVEVEKLARNNGGVCKRISSAAVMWWKPPQ